MSIQSTKSITREQAIDRISMVDSYIRNSDYLKLADMSFEYDHDLVKFVNGECRDIIDIDKWTDSMIVSLLNQPFYRHSMFDNYSIEV